jgi:hypothetical protein
LGLLAALGVGGLAVFEVSGPASIRWLGGLDTSGQACAAQVVGNLAYVADGSAGFQVMRRSGGPGFAPGFLLEPADQWAPLGATVTFRTQAVGEEPS